MLLSVARTWSVIGERWTILLILRQAFRGMTRFDDFQRTLGLGRNLLSDRLRLFVEEGPPRASGAPRAVGALLIRSRRLAKPRRGPTRG